MISDRPADWPTQVLGVVRDRVGDPQGYRRLSGLSGRAVVRVDGSDGAVVVKIDVEPRELQFYATRARVVAALGVTVPTAHYAGRPDGDDPQSPGWLVIEHLPAPLPRPRWLADPAVLTVLARLHGTVGVLDSIRDPFRPGWSAEVTGPAADRLPAAVGTDRLAELAVETGLWLTGSTPISGDPNPRNWGVRVDQTPVLFDWERIGFGHPAVDLGITLPGLPSHDDALAAATAYLKVAGPDAAIAQTGPAELARGLRLVKVWTAIELLADPRRGSALDTTCDWLVAHLPAWLDTLG